jgi:hypothetical protein
MVDAHRNTLRRLFGLCRRRSDDDWRRFCRCRTRRWWEAL